MPSPAFRRVQARSDTEQPPFVGRNAEDSVPYGLRLNNEKIPSETRFPI